MKVENGKIILHVGSHKTGTSTLQTFMQANRHELAKLNIIFPIFEFGGSETFRHSRIGLLLSSGNDDDFEIGVNKLRQHLGSLSHNHSLFITSEEFNRIALSPDGMDGPAGQRHYLRDYHSGSETYWRQRELFIKRLRDVFSEHDPEIWITLRRPDSFCVSMYQQVVRNRSYVGTIKDFMASNFALFDYERLLEQWKEFFSHVRVFIYEDALLTQGGTASAYLKAVGASNLIPRLISSGRKNIASHAHVTEFLRRTNYFPLDKRLLRECLQKWISAEGKLLLCEKYEFLSMEEREAFNSRFSFQNARIRQNYDVDTPGRDVLFPAVDSSANQVYPGMSDLEFDIIARGVALKNKLIP